MGFSVLAAWNGFIWTSVLLFPAEQKCVTSSGNVLHVIANLIMVQIMSLVLQHKYIFWTREAEKCSNKGPNILGKGGGGGGGGHFFVTGLMSHMNVAL